MKSEMHLHRFLSERWDNGVSTTSGDQLSNNRDNPALKLDGAGVNANPAPKPTPAQSSGAPADQKPANSHRREWLGLVRKTFSGVEAVSGTIPVVGSYVGAAAKVGMAFVDMVQVK
ncbi:hypothetical protein FS837_007810 [Tulasnella sp. UAMH 9824]|nr:hypothetical protein FS837_007810 [Tulasnella sp. UAMH 9824]